MVRRLLLICLALVALGVLPGGAAAAQSCPNEALRTNLSLRLPDCRAYEQVSPLDKDGSAARVTYNAQGLLFKASESGEGMFYVANNALPGSPAGGQTFYQASRNAPAAGWITAPLSPPNILATTPQSGDYGITGEYRWLSEDLSCELVQSSEPLTSDTPSEDVNLEVRNLYRRNAEGSATLVSNRVPSNSGEVLWYINPYVVLGATPDCRKIFFQTSYRLLGQAPGQSASSVYEWDEGALRLVSLLPNESSSVGVEGIKWESPWNRVSEDGSRVFFVTQQPSHQIFMREDNGGAGARTVEVSASQTSVPTASVAANFQAASRTGSRVFFTDGYGLAPNATSSGQEYCDNIGGEEISGAGCDLYEYDVESGGLIDLSADGNVADSNGADVVGVLGVSDDGAYVYFAAEGQLTPASGNASEKTEAENSANNELNVYLAHEGHLTFVANIARSDASKLPNADLIGLQLYWSARVTPDGKELLFTSTEPVTGYDNTDALTGKQDPEAYLFSAETGGTVCVSCDPSGAPPSFSVAQEGPLIPDSPAMWGQAAGDEPRVLSSDGSRVFFETPDQLSPLAKGGEVNVYEWERAGKGSCSASAQAYGPASGGCIFLLDSGLPQNEFSPPAMFVDASASGDDVFIQTSSKLLSQDEDGVQDIYDVRVGGGFPGGSGTVECEGEACQGLAAATSVFGTPSSASFAGAGNVPVVAPSVGPRALTRAQKLARALNACARLGARRRAACRQSARRRYGPACLKKHERGRAACRQQRLRVHRKAGKAGVKKGGER